MPGLRYAEVLGFRATDPGLRRTSEPASGFMEHSRIRTHIALLSHSYLPLFPTPSHSPCGGSSLVVTFGSVGVLGSMQMFWISIHWLNGRLW